MLRASHEPAPTAQIEMPRQLETLSPHERMIALAFRHACGTYGTSDKSDWLHLLALFTATLGHQAARKAAGAVGAVMRQLSSHAHRRISYHHLLCPCLGEDELSFVQLVAAVQHRNWRIATGIARTCLSEDGIGDMIAATSQLAVILTHHEVGLPLRITRETDISAIAPGAELPAEATLH